MCFDIPDDHIHALALALMGGFQHGECLPHARRIAQEDLQLAAPVFFGLQLVLAKLRDPGDDAP